MEWNLGYIRHMMETSRSRVIEAGLQLLGIRQKVIESNKLFKELHFLSSHKLAFQDHCEYCVRAYEEGCDTSAIIKTDYAASSLGFFTSLSLWLQGIVSRSLPLLLRPNTSESEAMVMEYAFIAPRFLSHQPCASSQKCRMSVVSCHNHRSASSFEALNNQAIDRKPDRLFTLRVIPTKY